MLHRRNGVVYFQLQIDIAREDGLCEETYYEYFKLGSDKTTKEIGQLALNLLDRFHTMGDLSVNDFYKQTGQSIDDYKLNQGKDYLKFMDAKDIKEVEEKYDECILEYTLADNKYSFKLSWTYRRGSRKLYECSDSTGIRQVLIFDKPLEFTGDIDAEKLGKMILESFDRSAKMADIMSDKMAEKMTHKMSGKYYTDNETRWQTHSR